MDALATSLQAASTEGATGPPPDCAVPSTTDVLATPSEAPGLKQEVEVKKAISFNQKEYWEVRYMIGKYLKRKRTAGSVEGEIIIWYMESVEKDIQNEHQLLEMQYRVQVVLDSMLKVGHIVVRQGSEGPRNL